MATNNKPANTMRCSNIKVTILQNRRKKGLPLLITSGRINRATYHQVSCSPKRPIGYRST
jgi:hypothetical protein